MTLTELTDNEHRGRDYFHQGLQATCQDSIQVLSKSWQHEDMYQLLLSIFPKSG